MPQVRPGARIRGNRAWWAFSYSGKESFSFSIRWMVSSPRTVSNLRKNVLNHDLSNSVAQFFVASQMHCVFCARQRLWRWGLKSLFAKEFKINTRVETRRLGIVFALYRSFHLCRNGCRGVLWSPPSTVSGDSFCLPLTKAERSISVLRVSRCD